MATVLNIRLSRAGPNTNSQLASLSVGGQLNIRFQCGLRLYHILQLSSVLLAHNPWLPLRVPGFVGIGLQFSIGFNPASASTPARPLA